MANYDSWTIKCENSEVIKSIAIDFEGEKILNLNSVGYILFVDEDYKECAFSGRNGFTHKEIEGLSKKFNNDVIHCSVSFEHSNFDEIYYVDYKNGIDEMIGLEPNYTYSNFNTGNEETDKKIVDKMVDFFKLVDVVKKDEKGFKVEWPEGEVVYIFECDNFKVEAEKAFNRINVKLFKKREEIKVVWEEFEHCKECECLPF